MKSNKKEKNRSYEGVLAVLLLSCALTAVGICLYLYPDISFAKFCVFLGVMMTLFGFIRILRYFLQEKYRDITNYDFTIGLILVSAGVCTAISSERIGGGGIQFLGALVLLNSVIMIQYAIQIRFMDGKLFPLAIVLAVLVYAFGMFSVIEPHRFFHTRMELFSIALSASGVLGLISLVLAWARSRNLRKEEKRDAERILEEDPGDVKEPSVVVAEGQPLQIDVIEGKIPDAPEAAMPNVSEPAIPDTSEAAIPGAVEQLPAITSDNYLTQSNNNEEK